MFITNKKSREEEIQSLQFFNFLQEIYYSVILKEKNNQNPLIQKFIQTFQYYLEWESNNVSGYIQLLCDYPYWESRNFYCETMEEFLANKLTADDFKLPET